MARPISSILVPILALLLAALAFHLAADPGVKSWKRRFRPKEVVHPGQWTDPALRHGRREAVESRAVRAGLGIALPPGEAYRLRFFYLWEGDRSAPIAGSDGRLGSLSPGKGWRRTYVRVGRVAPGGKLPLFFDLSPGGRLTLRRIDARNYLLRLGDLLLLKPRGGTRAPYSALAMAATLGGMVVVGAFGACWGRRRGREGLPEARAFLPAGLVGLALVLHQLLSPYPVHAKPLLLGSTFLLLSFAGVMRGTEVLGGKLSWKRLSMVGAGALAGLVAAELVLWFWNPAISRPRIGSYARHSPRFGWENRPGARGWQVDIGYHIRINRHGHRGPEYPREKPPGRFRILGLGDSFAFGWGVEEERTFYRVLERHLRREGHPVDVLNAAVPAWHSSQSLAYLRAEGKNFGADLAVIPFFVDDVYDKSLAALLRGPHAERMREEEVEFRRAASGGNLARLLRLYNVWFNYRKILRAAADYRRRNPYPTFESERPALRRNFDRDPGLMAGLERIVEEWAKARQTLGIPVLFTFIPPGGAIGAPDYQGFDRGLGRVAAERGFPYLDLIPLLEGHPRPRTLYLHPRDGHMSAAGHAVVGEALARAVLACGMLEGRRVGGGAP